MMLSFRTPTLIILLIPAILSFGQSDFSGVGNSLIDPYDMYHIMANGQKNKINLSEVKGSPFEQESFVFGKAMDKLTATARNYYLRYNAYNDEIQMKASLEDKDVYALIKSLNIYAVINNKEYHYLSYADEDEINEGYFVLVSKELKNHLYTRKSKRFKPGRPAKDSFREAIPPSFKDIHQFYYKKGRVLYPLSNKKKGILDQFSDKKSELKKYLKDENIDLKDEKDVLKLLQYYESMVSTN